MRINCFLEGVFTYKNETKALYVSAPDAASASDTATPARAVLKPETTCRRVTLFSLFITDSNLIINSTTAL